jgi:hypothetical protein
VEKKLFQLKKFIDYKSKFQNIKKKKFRFFYFKLKKIGD